MLPGEKLGHYVHENLEIKLKEDVIINQPPYRIPHSLQNELDSASQSMLKDGVITKSKSSYNSSLIIVKRAGHTPRVCLDYRRLNEVIEKISFPLPKISDVLSSIGHSTFMSTLDLVSAYHQLQLDPADRYLTAFTVGSSKYEFLRVPFGLQSSPAFFARVTNNVMYDMLGPQYLVYLDDIVLFGKTREEHLRTIQSVLETLQKAGLKLKIRKCNFFAKEIEFLGYKLNEQGMKMNPEKVKAIKAMPMPTNKRQLQSFLGAVNYYRLFIEQFATIADPLYRLLRKNVPFTWTEEQTNAVETLKDKLAQAPIVKNPDYTKPLLYLQTPPMSVWALY